MQNTRALENVFFNNQFFGVLRRNNQMFRDIGCDYCFWTIHFRFIWKLEILKLTPLHTANPISSPTPSYFACSSSSWKITSPSQQTLHVYSWVKHPDWPTLKLFCSRNRQSFPSAKSRDLKVSINTDNNKVYIPCYIAERGSQKIKQCTIMNKPVYQCKNLTIENLLQKRAVDSNLVCLFKNRWSQCPR